MLTNCLKTYPFSLLLLAAVCVLSLMPFPEIDLAKDVPLADKWTHMVMYGGLTLVIWWEYGRSHHLLNALRLMMWGIVAPVLLGGVLELMQEYCTATRSGEWLDFLADGIGVLIGAVMGVLVLRFWISK